MGGLHQPNLAYPEAIANDRPTRVAPRI